MGTCFGHIKKKNKSKRHVSIHRCFYFQDQEKVEFELLVDGDAGSSTEYMADSSEVWYTCKRPPKNIYAKAGKRRLKKEEDNGLSGEVTQLLPLDAHSLLASRAVQSRKVSWSSSTPPSSIDLEWEHEGGIASVASRLKSQISSSSNIESSLCEGASPESLEWDPGTDGETEHLISEIERLTARALQETGAWTSPAPQPSLDNNNSLPFT